MVTETTEQRTDVTEANEKGNGTDKTASTPVQKGLSTQPADSVSTKAETTQETRGEKPSGSTPLATSEPALPKTREEFDLAVEKAVNTRAQSMKDKELSPLQTKMSELTKENVRLKKESARKTEDTLVDILERQTEEGDLDENAPRIKDFTKFRALIERIRKVDDMEETADDTAERQTIIERTQQARARAISHLMPEQGEDFIKEVDTLTKELMAEIRDVESEETIHRIWDLSLKVRGQKVTTPGKPEKKLGLTRTDSSRHTGSGGDNLANLSPSERAKEADRRLRIK